MNLQRLYPDRVEIGPEELISGLALGQRAPTERPFVVLNMVTTIDGKAAVEGRSGGLSNEFDRTIFHHLRTQVDAVMVGATTVAVEQYGRLIKSPELRAKRQAEGLEPDPLAVVVSGRLSLPPEVPLLHEPEQPVLVATGSEESLEGVGLHVEYLRSGDDLSLLMSHLREERGIRSVLCEGGPTLNSHLLGAGLVDELFLTLAAKIAGGSGAPSMVEGRPLMRPVEAALIWLCEGGGDLFQRWQIGR